MKIDVTNEKCEKENLETTLKVTKESSLPNAKLQAKK